MAYRDVKYLETQTVWTKTYGNKQGTGWSPTSPRTYKGQFLSSASGRTSIKHGNHIIPLANMAWKLDGYPVGFKFTETFGTSTTYDIICSGKPKMTNSVLLYPYLLKGTFEGTVFFNTQVHNGTKARARNQLISKLANKSDVNLGQTVGEFRTSASMIRSRLLSLAYAIRALRRGNVGLAFKHLGVKGRGPHGLGKDAANAYLEYKYGWRPLVNDILNAQAAIQDVLSRKAGATHTENVRVSSNISPSILSTRWKREGSIKYSVEYGVVYTIPDMTAHGLGALGLGNLLSLAWELMPLSFVVNWMVSVGSFLDGFSTLRALEFQGGYYTLRVENDIQLFDYGLLPSGFDEPVEFRMKSKGVKRIPLIDFPPPSLHFTFATSEGVRQQRLTSLLALILQRS